MAVPSTRTQDVSDLQQHVLEGSVGAGGVQLQFLNQVIQLTLQM
jgi:hypothetical protein